MIGRRELLASGAALVAGLSSLRARGAPAATPTGGGRFVPVDTPNGVTLPYKMVGGRYFYFGLGGDCWMSAPREVREANASQIARSAECIIISDVVERFPISNGIWLMNVDPVYASEGPSKVHGGGSNCLFCDGHVTRMLLEDIA